MKPQAPLFLSLRLALGALFAVSGFQKLAAPYQNFSAVIAQYEIVKGPAADVLAQTLPWLEFLGGVFFMLGLWETAALAALVSLNLLFIGVLASALLRKLPIQDCGCFGGAVHLSPPATLGLDILFLSLFTFYYRARGRR